MRVYQTNQIAQTFPSPSVHGRLLENTTSQAFLGLWYNAACVNSLFSQYAQPTLEMRSRTTVYCPGLLVACYHYSREDRSPDHHVVLPSGDRPTRWELSDTM